MTTKFKFDMEAFRNSLKAAFENLGEDGIRDCLREGVEEAFHSRIEDLIRYEFQKAMNDRMFGDREALFAEESFSPEVSDALIRRTLRKIARQYAQEVINRSIR